MSARSFSVRTKYAIRSPVGRPRHPGHRVPAAAGRDDVLEPVVLVEARREIPDDRAVVRRQQDDVELLVLAVAGHRGHQLARRRRLDREHRRELRLLRVRRQVAPVVGRPLLVAERLEPILQVFLELLVELFRLQLERFLVGVVAAADDALAQREEVLAQAFLAPARFDELEDGVSEVVDEARVAEPAVALEVASSSGRCRRRPRRGPSSGRADARCRSCSPTGPRSPTAARCGG